MGGVHVPSFVKPLQVVYYTTLPGASATVNVLSIWPWFGWGTVRIYCASDIAATLNIFQKDRTGDAIVPGTFRLTDSEAIPANSATVPALTEDYLIAAPYGRIQVVTTTAPTRFVLIATLMP